MVDEKMVAALAEMLNEPQVTEWLEQDGFAVDYCWDGDMPNEGVIYIRINGVNYDMTITESKEQ